MSLVPEIILTGFFFHEEIFTQQIIAGGTFALYSLLCRHAKVGVLPIDRSVNGVMHYEAGSPLKIKVESRAWRAIAKHKSSHYLMLCLALFGSCMTIGEGVLTPALSGSAVQRTFSASFCFFLITGVFGASPQINLQDTVQNDPSTLVG